MLPRMKQGAKISASSPKERVTARLGRLLKEGSIPGIQYMVVDATSTWFQYTGGVLDVANPSISVKDDSKFLSSSSTKVLTASAIWKLCETNKVQLDAPLSKYYSKHPYGDQVTLRHLLNHSSGIPNPIPVSWLHIGNDDDSSTFDEEKALEEALEANPKLEFGPGERYAYSNLSYWLLGKVIEEVSGMSYRDYLKQEIFEPLGITENEMTFDRSASQTTFAQGHQERFSILSLFFWALTSNKLWDKSVGKWARFQQYLLMNGPAYGGCIGTATGYAKILQDMLLALQTDGKEPKLFTSSINDFIEPQYSSKAPDLFPSTCIGFNRGENDNHTYFTKVGGGPGFSSNIRIYPNAGIATVYLCNKTEVSEGPVNSFLDKLDKDFL